MANGSSTKVSTASIHADTHRYMLTLSTAAIFVLNNQLCTGLLTIALRFRWRIYIKKKKSPKKGSDFVQLSSLFDIDHFVQMNRRIKINQPTVG